MTTTIRRTRPFALLAALLLALAAVGITPAAASNGAERTRVIVRFADGVDAGAEAAAVARSGARVAFVYHDVFPGLAGELPAAAIDALSRRADVLSIERDGVVSIASPGVQSNATWGLDRIDQRERSLDRTYSYPSTGSGVRAYILDTGVRSTHVDFGGRVVAGFSAFNDSVGTEDCQGHGTHVAGTVAGTVWGVAKAATIVPVRVLGCTGSGSWSGIIAGLDWVVANHPSGSRGVVNMSLGGSGTSSTMNAAVQRVVDRGIPVVAAAGNSNTDACGFTPANAPSALAIGATTSSDARASYSNFGPCVDLFAPGSGITSAVYTSDTASGSKSGTSMAAPHVAGVVALILALTPAATPAQVKEALVDSATVDALSSIGTGSPNLLLYSDPDSAPGEVVPPPVAPDPKAAVIASIVNTPTAGGRAANSQVLVVDEDATATGLAGVTVVGRWYLNGVAQSTTASAVTGSDGVASFSSPRYAKDSDVALRLLSISGPDIASRTFEPPLASGELGSGPDDDTDDGTGDDPGDGPDGLVPAASISISNGRWLSGTATVVVTDSTGPRAGVQVFGYWRLPGVSGDQDVVGTTSSAGSVSFGHQKLSVGTGTLIFCVVRLAVDGVGDPLPVPHCVEVTRS